MGKIGEGYKELTEGWFEEGRVCEKEKEMIGVGMRMYGEKEYCMI